MNHTKKQQFTKDVSVKIAPTVGAPQAVPLCARARPDYNGSVDDWNSISYQDTGLMIRNSDKIYRK